MLFEAPGEVQADAVVTSRGRLVVTPVRLVNDDRPDVLPVEQVVRCDRNRSISSCRSSIYSRSSGQPPSRRALWRVFVIGHDIAHIANIAPGVPTLLRLIAKEA